MLRRRFSISLRLTMWFGALFFVGFLLFGAAMWWNLRQSLTGERRQTLARRLDRLQDLMDSNTGQDEAQREQGFRDFARATGNGLGEILWPNGAPAYPAPTAAASNFPWPQVTSSDGEEFSHVYSGDQPYWVMARHVAVNGQELVLLAAAPEAANLQVLQGFLRGLFASVPIVLLLASAGGYWISRRALRPVDAMTATARQIGIRNLSERLPVSRTGDELQRLAETWNDMMDRLESSVVRLKQFTADASHELRGPLSFTRTVAEAALRNRNADEQSRRALQDIVDETIKSATLLEHMLLLARTDTESVGMAFGPVDLIAVVTDTCGMAQPLARDKGLTLQVNYPPHPMQPVVGDASNLCRLLWILLDNALKYTPPSGRVDVSLSLDPEAAILSVKDTGVGIADADLPYVFDRFYRADRSRGQVEGNGLGLSIAKWIADTHRADLTVSSVESVGSLFQLRFQLNG